MELAMEQESTIEPTGTGKGFLQGLLYGLIPHIGCIAFVVFTILGVTLASAILKKFLLNNYFFYGLVALSFTLATISATLYLKKNGILSLQGAKRKLGYLSILYGTTLVINLLMFFVVFPAVANVDLPRGQATTPTGAFAGVPAGSPVGSVEQLTLKVDIPCSGHAPLVKDELNNLAGIKSVKFRFPNYFDVSYDSASTSKEQILSLGIFDDFKAEVVG